MTSLRKWLLFSLDFLLDRWVHRLHVPSACFRLTLLGRRHHFARERRSRSQTLVGFRQLRPLPAVFAAKYSFECHLKGGAKSRAPVLWDPRSLTLRNASGIVTRPHRWQTKLLRVVWPIPNDSKSC